jgi:hypothetical protein
MNKLTKICRCHKTHFWGSDYLVTPRLVDWIHGDGLQVIGLWALNTRPNYYIARIDSKVSLDNDPLGPSFCNDVLDVLCDEIEDQYGRSYEEWEADNGRTYKRHNPFPAASFDSGTCWDRIATLREPDRRTESCVRQDIAHSKHRTAKT